MSPIPKDDISKEAYNEIRRLLPGSFEEYSHEFLTQMIYDFDLGYPPRTGAWLTEDAKKEFDKSPRAYLISLLRKERDGAIECLRLLGVDTHVHTGDRFEHTCSTCKGRASDSGKICEDCDRLIADCNCRSHFASCGSG
jgi:hypothetical protein